MDYIRAIERQQIREDIPQVRVADNVKVHYRIKEGDRERIQVFQGDVIRMAGAGARETFTVRKISFGVGVERTFPLHSPKIAKLEVGDSGAVEHLIGCDAVERIAHLRIDVFDEAGAVKGRGRTGASPHIGIAQVFLRLGEHGPELLHQRRLPGRGHVGQGRLVQAAGGQLPVQTQPRPDHDLIHGVAQIGQPQIAHFVQRLGILR